MKRFVSILLCFSLLFSLCACGQNQETTDSSEEVISSSDNPNQDQLLHISEQLKDNPDQPELLVQRAEIYQSMGSILDMAYAEADYLHALAIDPNQEDIYRKRAELYRSLGAEAQAIDILCLGTEYDCSDEYIQYVAQQQSEWTNTEWNQFYEDGQSYLAEKNLQAAITSFTEAIAVDPDRLEAVSARADVCAESDSETDLLQAEEDYLTLINKGSNSEQIYSKLADVYSKLERPEDVISILQQGAEELDSDELRNRALQMEIDSYSDNDLIQIANENIMSQYGMIYGVYQGAYLNQDWNTSIFDDDGTRWFLVDDDRASSLEELESLWHESFAADYPLPEGYYYREINGILYTANLGVGGPYIDIILNEVESREGNTAYLSGYVHDPFGRDMETRNRYQVVLRYEEGKWKFAGDEEEDLPGNIIPDDQEYKGTYLTEGNWGWAYGPSLGGAYDLYFYEDGTYFATSVNGGYYTMTGVYEYDGETLYIDGAKFVWEDNRFKTEEPYIAQGSNYHGKIYNRNDRLYPDDETDAEDSIPETSPTVPTEPNTIPTDESKYQIPVREPHIPEPENELWREIVNELIQYGMDISNDCLESFTQKDQFVALRELLSHKEMIQLIMDAGILNEIDDDATIDAITEAYINHKSDNEMFPVSDEGYEIVLPLILQLAVDHREFGEKCLETITKLAPGFALEVFADASKDKKFMYGLPPKYRFLIAVFESSYERYHEFGEAVAELQSISGEHARLIMNQCNKYFEDRSVIRQRTIEMAIDDKKNQNSDHLGSVKRITEMADEAKEMFIQEIEKLQTFGFKLMHPIINSKLNEFKDHIRAIDSNYEELYWIMVS